MNKVPNQYQGAGANGANGGAKSKPNYRETMLIRYLA
jgi:hypothetical protein